MKLNILKNKIVGIYRWFQKRHQERIEAQRRLRINSGDNAENYKRQFYFERSIR